MVRLETENGCLVIDDFDEDSHTTPVEVDQDAMLDIARAESNAASAATEKAAQRLESYSHRDVLIPLSRAVEIVRGGA